MLLGKSASHFYDIAMRSKRRLLLIAKWNNDRLASADTGMITQELHTQALD